MSDIKRKVFYSFHFDNDVFRVQQVRQMGVIAGDEPVSTNTWEEIKRSDAGIKKWIDDNLYGKSCLVVLVGSKTAERPWVRYEIKRAWELGKGVVGVNIHNLKCLKTGYCSKGANPFDGITFKNNGRIYVPQVYDPDSRDAYRDIHMNLSTWVERAIADAS